MKGHYLPRKVALSLIVHYLTRNKVDGTNIGEDMGDTTDYGFEKLKNRITTEIAVA